MGKISYAKLDVNMDKVHKSKHRQPASPLMSRVKFNVRASDMAILVMSSHVLGRIAVFLIMSWNWDTVKSCQCGAQESLSVSNKHPPT